jgi:acetyl-CoA acetyltransferase
MPLTKAGKGGFKNMKLDFLIHALLKKVVEKSRLDPVVVEDICLGNISTTYLRDLCQLLGGQILYFLTYI